MVWIESLEKWAKVTLSIFFSDTFPLFTLCKIFLVEFPNPTRNHEENLINDRVVIKKLEFPFVQFITNSFCGWIASFFIFDNSVTVVSLQHHFLRFSANLSFSHFDQRCPPSFFPYFSLSL